MKLWCLSNIRKIQKFIIYIAMMTTISIKKIKNICFYFLILLCYLPCPL